MDTETDKTARDEIPIVHAKKPTGEEPAPEQGASAGTATPRVRDQAAKYGIDNAAEIARLKNWLVDNDGDPILAD